VSAESADQELRRKAAFLRSAARVSTAAAAGYLTKVFGPELGASAGETLALAGEGVVGLIEQREQSRIARTLIQVHDEVMRRTARGETVRELIADPQGEDAVAVFEAVVEVAARSNEERKCEVIANLYASVAFDDSVSIGDALLYVRRVRDASWRQLVAVHYFDQRAQAGKGVDVVTSRQVMRGQPALGAELNALRETLGLLEFGEEREEELAMWEGVPDGFASAGPQVVHLTDLGRALHRLGRIAEVVSQSDLDDVASEVES
jgi:hypothetical protein